MLSRRRVLGALGAAPLLRPNHLLAQRQATPESTAPEDRVVTYGSEALVGQIEIDHFRVVGKSRSMLVIGAMINMGDDAVDVPSLVNVVARDTGDVIVGSAFLQPDYPILPPGERIGFNAYFSSLLLEDVDPARIGFDVDVDDMTTRAVERLAERPVEILRAEDVSTDDENLEIESEVRNASDVDFEHGLVPRASVWDRDGHYCGYAYANVMMQIPAGDTVRFTTLTTGGGLNPMELTGEEFTWDLWVDPR